MSRLRSIPTVLARLAVVLGAAAALAACHGATPSARLTSAPSPRLELSKSASFPDAQAGPLNALPPPQAVGEAAEALNAERPFADLPIEAMRPFVLKTDAADRERAVHCLAQAVYYEAAREPLKGQEAVAQVVLNRVRHPAYPKSVCGVVYQGASLPTGCQFTFTCDGSLRRTPEAAYWDRAVFVARQALGGFVDKDVGSATHYHAAYVAPYWAPTMVKLTQVGQQIFYRWAGGWGEPQAFTGRYAGHEAVLTQALLRSGDVRGPATTTVAAEIQPERHVTLGVQGGARTYEVADAGSPTEAKTRAMGTLYASRPAPTADQVRAINAKLEAMEEHMNHPAAADVAQAAVPASAEVSSAAPSPAG